MNERTRQWFGLLGSAVAWLFHLVATSVVAESACILEGSLFVFLGLSAAGWLLIWISLVALIICIGSVRVAWAFRKDERESARFMGRAGIVTGLIFLLVILAQSIPIPILLNGC